MTATTLPACRFLVPDAAVHDVFQRCVEADARACRLSPSFRAYYQLRSLIPLSVRRWLQRRRPVRASERWCYPDEFFAALAQVALPSSDGWPIIHPWPLAADFALVLTHDVETQEGIANIATIADLEEELGFRSSWNVVPYKYNVDCRLLRDLQDRGFEVGVHGFNHDGKLFTSRRTFERRVPFMHDALKSFGAVGFRAPMVHHNFEWMQTLDVEYDASCFDADPYQAMPGGVGGIWPFIAGRFVELPYTLPQDHTLFIARGERTEDTWVQKLNFIARWGGMALLITHPDYLNTTQRLDAYRRFLEHARSHAGAWPALPKDAAAWWRDRDESTLRPNLINGWQIVGPAADRGRPAAIRFDGDEQSVMCLSPPQPGQCAIAEVGQPVASR